MASIHLQGILVDSVGEIDVGGIITFTHLTTTGGTIASTQTELIIPPDGAYSIDVEYGQIRIDYTTRNTERFVANVIVNSASTATSLPELLSATTPVANPIIIQMQGLVADAVTAQVAAEAAETGAVAAEATLLAEKLTTVQLIALSNSFAVGSVIDTLGYTSNGDGGGAQWVKSGISGSTPSQSPAQLGSAVLSDGGGNQWALAYNGPILPESLGAVGDGVTDDTLAIQAAINSSSGLVRLPNLVFFSTINLKSDLRIFGGKVIGGKILCDTLTDVVIENVKFDNGWSNSGSDCIYITSSTVRVESCDFERLSNQYPIRFNNSSVEIIGNRVNNSTYGIENIGVSSAAGVFGAFSESVVIANNVIANVAGSAINIVGVLGAAGSANWLAGWDRSNSIIGSCVIEGNSITDITGYATVYRAWNCTFTGNIIKRCQPPTFQGGNITCTANHLRDMLTVAIDFGNVTLGTCSNNVIDTCEYAAIEINACFKVTVANNTLQQYSTVTTSGKGSAGIWLHGATATTVPARTCENINVIGNQLSVATAGALYGISVEDVGTKAVLVFNQMQGAGTTTEIVTDSLKVRAMGNMNDFAYDNDKIYVDGAITDATLPSAP